MQIVFLVHLNCINQFIEYILQQAIFCNITCLKLLKLF